MTRRHRMRLAKIGRGARRLFGHVVQRVGRVERDLIDRLVVVVLDKELRRAAAAHHTSLWYGMHACKEAYTLCDAEGNAWIWLGSLQLRRSTLRPSIPPRTFGRSCSGRPSRSMRTHTARGVPHSMAFQCGALVGGDSGPVRVHACIQPAAVRNVAKLVVGSICDRPVARRGPCKAPRRPVCPSSKQRQRALLLRFGCARRRLRRSARATARVPFTKHGSPT